MPKPSIFGSVGLPQVVLVPLTAYEQIDSRMQLAVA